MKIGGLEFPYDRKRDVSNHGPVVGFLMRVHPLALWVPAILLGMLLGFVLGPGSLPSLWIPALFVVTLVGFLVIGVVW